MIAHAKTLQTRKRRRPKAVLPETRPSILDPCLDSEPWLGPCCCSESLCLFLNNYPIAIIPATPLDYFALDTRLSQLRHRWPRQS
jgi:hypothetical protein